MHAPYTKLSKRKIKQNAKPWITYGIRKSVRKKNKYYGLFMKRNDTSIFLKYKHYRNKINHLIKLSKKNHYLNYFNRFKSNMKRTWQGIKCIMNVSSNKNKYCLQEGDRLITDPLMLANKFNIYFNKLASNLVSKMKPSNKSHKDYLESCVLDSFFINPTTTNEILTLINQLDSDKSSGIYNFRIKLVKLAGAHIASPLQQIISDSFLNGCFPSKLKIQKIIPLFKGGSRLNITN